MFVGRERDRGAKLSALAPCAVAPNDLELIEARRVFGDRQFGPCQRQARPAVTRLRIGKVDIVVGRVVWRQIHAQHATLSLSENGRHVLHRRLGALLGYQPERTHFFRDEHSPVGQERDAPRQVERCHLRHRERQVWLGLLCAHVDLRPSRGGYERQKQCCTCEGLHRISD